MNSSVVWVAVAVRKASAEEVVDAFGLTSCCLCSDRVRRQDNIPWQQHLDLGLDFRLRQLGEDVAQMGVGGIVTSTSLPCKNTRHRSASRRSSNGIARAHRLSSELAQDELTALILFKSEMSAYLRLYTFLSHIFDYGNTVIEKRAILYRQLNWLLEFDREHEDIDFSDQDKLICVNNMIKEKLLGSEML